MAPADVDISLEAGVYNHYICASHDMQGFVCFNLFLFLAVYYGFYQKKCNWGTKSIHAILWMMFLFGQALFCFFMSIWCQFGYSDFVFYGQSITNAFNSVTHFVTGVYIISSIKNQALFSTKKTVIIHISYFVFILIISYILNQFSTDINMDKSAIAVFGIIGNTALSVSFYFLYKH